MQGNSICEDVSTNIEKVLNQFYFLNSMLSLQRVAHKCNLQIWRQKS